MIKRTELIDKWIAALRSGEYEQGRGALCSDGGKMCCLGVLADVAGALRRNGGGGMGYVVHTQGYHELFMLPDEHARDWGVSDVQGELSELNDNGYSFEQIADHIERELSA